MRTLALLICMYAILTVPSPARADGYEACQRIVSGMIALHRELLEFENLPSFRNYGFGAGGPHSDWLDRVRDLQKNVVWGEVIAHTANDHAVAPGDLVGWGLAKRACVETGDCRKDQTRWFERELAKMRCKR